MNLGRIGKTGGQEEADEEAHRQCDQDTLQVEADRLRVGIPDHEIGNQGRDAGGEQHGIDIGAELLLPDNAVDHHAENGGPDIQDVNAPGAEAQRQHKGQGGHIGGGALEGDEQQQGDKAHQSHIQEGGRIAADVEIVGGQLAGLAQDLPQTGEHTAPVGHNHSGDQKRGGEEGEKQLQELALAHGTDLFHGKHLYSLNFLYCD